MQQPATSFIRLLSSSDFSTPASNCSATQNVLFHARLRS